MYIFVRQDIDISHQIVQSNHATLSLASHYGVEGIPNIVLIGVPDVAALKRACHKLSDNQIPHWSWIEPDGDLGFTAIATAPIEGGQRKCLENYRLWKSERTGSSIGRAADSNSVCCGFDSRPVPHAAVAQRKSGPLGLS